MALGLMATGVNAYTVLFRWANGNIPAEVVPIGMGESLTTLIMGGLLVPRN